MVFVLIRYRQPQYSANWRSRQHIPLHGMFGRVHRRYEIRRYPFIGLRGSSYFHFRTMCTAIGGLELNRIPDIEPQLDKPAEMVQDQRRCRSFVQVHANVLYFPKWNTLINLTKENQWEMPICTLDTCYAWRRMCRD